MYYLAFLIAVLALGAFLVFLKIFQKLTLGRCKSPVCLVGKTALITGGNSGIGYETALGLAARGCRVIIADKDNCEASKSSIILKTGNKNIITKHFNLASLTSIRQLAKDINETEERLDILINNAGTVGLGNKYTSDGLHIGMQVNHFGPFLLTHLLIGLLKKSAPSRIIFVSSAMAYIGSYTTPKSNLNVFQGLAASPFTEALVYSNSKFCNVLATFVLAKKLNGTGVTANSLHPGLVYTPIYRNFYKCNYSWPTIPTLIMNLAIRYCVFLFSKSAEEGAQTSLFLAMDESVKSVSGKFFGDCIRFKMPPRARSDEYINEIWSTSENFVKLQSEERL